MVSKVTESINNNSSNIDLLNTNEILSVINAEDKKVAFEVEKAIPQIATVVNKITEVIIRGGRVFYVGAGTSGRLGVLDASECPPTFSVEETLFQGIIAGGNRAIRSAVEGAEDSYKAGIEAFNEYGITAEDAVIGLSASGSAKFVISVIKKAAEVGAYTASIACNANSALAEQSQDSIIVVVGPEVITGSTRMKAGTAQKLVLNMLSTTAMIKIGKTYGNLMVDLKASNEKLRNRAIHIVMEVTNASYELAFSTLSECQWHVKTALVMILLNYSYKDAKHQLQINNGFVRKVLE